ncbi:hypothetical protein MtrunA17_Chr4g0070661 [Medicago truncatula]|uniref:Uncharacterized protein n=1 Tax=Medicago truncatula TaxID=3880 RepID=A0A396IG53_MEDTR|nr:hypothetical protein MtrunA17_Chr4g0070661 [Medicago truncatula]
MIRSNGVRLLSSHLIRDSCKSIYEGVFHRTLDSGLWTLSRVIGGGGVAHGHGVNVNNRVLPNSSIRGSASLSRYHIYESYPSSSSLVKRKRKGRKGIDGVTDADFQKGFENWCKKHKATFSSEEDKQTTFNWFRKTYIYGREFPCAAAPPVHLKDIIDCIRRYGIHGDSKVKYEFLLERSRHPIYPPYLANYNMDDPSVVAEFHELEEVSKCNCPDCCTGRDLGQY